MASGQLEGEEFVQASRDYAELEPVAKLALELKAAREEVAGLEEMLADPEMRGMAEEELEALNQRIPELEQQLAVAMLPRDSADAKPAMLEIRAGTGGDEAALFAGDLYRMYERFAGEQGWKVEPVSMSASEVGGFKEIVANVTGTGVFAKLKFGNTLVERLQLLFDHAAHLGVGKHLSQPGDFLARGLQLERELRDRLELGIVAACLDEFLALELARGHARLDLCEAVGDLVEAFGRDGQWSFRWRA